MKTRPGQWCERDLEHLWPAGCESLCGARREHTPAFLLRFLSCIRQAVIALCFYSELCIFLHIVLVMETGCGPLATYASGTERKMDGGFTRGPVRTDEESCFLFLPLSQCGVVSILQIRGHVFKGHFLKYTYFVTAIYVPMFSVFFPS